MIEDEGEDGQHDALIEQLAVVGSYRLALVEVEQVRRRHLLILREGDDHVDALVDHHESIEVVLDCFWAARVIWNCVRAEVEVEWNVPRDWDLTCKMGFKADFLGFVMVSE